jgi:hypothetical protein
MADASTGEPLPLSRYNVKRDFKVTSEPAGTLPPIPAREARTVSHQSRVATASAARIAPLLVELRYKKEDRHPSTVRSIGVVL